MSSNSTSTPTLATIIVLAVCLVAAVMISRVAISTSPLLPTLPPLSTLAPTLPPNSQTPTPPHTSTPSPTPTPLPTPTPTPLPLSAPFIGPDGQLAYVEDGRLTVLGRDGGATVVAEAGAVHDGMPLLWSPDGRRLLYTTQQADEREEYHAWDAASGQTFHLGQEFPALMDMVHGVTETPWSPDGSRILFFSATSENPVDSLLQSEYWVVDLDARRWWQVTEGSAALPATWASTRTLVYASYYGTDAESLRLVDIESPAATLTNTLGSIGGDYPYALSPDRRYVAGVAWDGAPNERLRVAPLPDHPPPALPAQPTVTVPLGRAPLWSPDGRWIAYGALAMAAPEAGEGVYTVLVDTIGISPTRVITGFVPRAWSPDGRLLAGGTCLGNGCGLAVTGVFSGPVKVLVPGGQTQAWDAAWSPQGTYLAYSDPDGMMLWDRATGERRSLMPGGEAGRFTDLAWSPDSCYLYFAQRENLADSPVDAIWGVGPDWAQHWQVAPGNPGGEGRLPCPASLLPGRRLVAFYGTSLGPGLGILGRTDITTTLTQLREQIAAYQALDPDTENVPVFHMVTTIADATPGEDEDYNHRVPLDTTRPWIEGVRAAGGWAIVDIQPAHADLDVELEWITPLLLETDVHLAVDPEFIMAEADHVPGSQLGTITGPQVNRIQAWVEQIARVTGQRKLLIIHQFNNQMVEQKDEILDYTLVDLVWDADGFGGPSPKIGDYVQYSGEAGFEYGGFKIFYVYDEPVMTPEQVLALDPPVTLIIYQ